MSGDIQVVEIGEKNCLVPNLTISVDKEEDEKDVPVIEYDQEAIDHENISEKNIKVKREFSSFPRKKIYENNLIGNAASLGLSFEEAEAKRKKRAGRFQSILVKESEVKELATPEELLLQSQKYVEKIHKFNEVLSLDNEAFIRLEAIHLEGVGTMSTNDIFAYFGNCNPHHIEWINDGSCNVVWSNSESCRITMEKVFLPPTAAMDTQKSAPSMFDDDLDLNMETDNLVNEELVDEVEIPLNPLRKARESFRKNNKESSLHARYAVIGDRKEKFAAKNSKYYMKHGNPHYGGTKGLLTSSYRRRYQMKKAMKDFRDMSSSAKQEEEEDVKRSCADDSKRLRLEEEDEDLMKSTVKDLANSDSDEEGIGGYGTMMADRLANELNTARKTSGNSQSHESTRNHIHSRLGKNRDSRYHERSFNRADEKLRLSTSVLRSDRKRKRELKRHSPPPWE